MDSEEEAHKGMYHNISQLSIHNAISRLKVLSCLEVVYFLVYIVDFMNRWIKDK